VNLWLIILTCISEKITKFAGKIIAMPRLSVIIIFIFSTIFAKAQVPDICLTKDEYRLYSLINESRAKKGLAVIPISKSLSYVAKIHARDLFHNNPDTSFCSLNSWSDQGPWTDCCHSKYTPNPTCIVNKPSELTKYPGEGHELCFWDSETLNPDTVMKFWLSVDAAREIFMNEKKWGYFNWKAMGVGMYKGYVCLWLGEMLDSLSEPTLCGSAPGADFLPMPDKPETDVFLKAPTGRYYLIFASLKTEADARKEVERFKKEGFSQSKIILKDNLYRVSLSDYKTQQEALNAKKELGEKYKAAWVTKF
jgi:hypothetical protein